jgi:hypothetical protein
MQSKQRFLTFGVGAMIGVLLLWGFNRQADPAREARREVMHSLSLPGMYYDHAVQGKALHGHFVLSERVFQLPSGVVTRQFVSGGRNRFDREGRPLPNDLILVTERYAAGTTPTEDSPVSAFTFAFADRGEVELAPGSASTADLGKGLAFPLKVTPIEGRPGVSLLVADLAQAKGNASFALLDHLEALVRTGVARRASPLPIDWQAEADRIRRESMR